MTIPNEQGSPRNSGGEYILQRAHHVSSVPAERVLGESAQVARVHEKTLRLIRTSVSRVGLKTSHPTTPKLNVRFHVNYSYRCAVVPSHT